MKNVSFTNAWHSNVHDLDVMDNLVHEVTAINSLYFSSQRRDIKQKLKTSSRGEKCVKMLFAGKCEEKVLVAASHYI